MLSSETYPLLFVPVVYRILDTWDLLTVDGLPPTVSYYTFMPLDEYHSSRERPIEVWQAMRAEQWKTYSLEELNLTLHDFTITACVFQMASPAYAQLLEELTQALLVSAPQNSTTTPVEEAHWLARAAS